MHVIAFEVGAEFLHKRAVDEFPCRFKIFKQERQSRNPDSGSIECIISCAGDSHIDIAGNHFFKQFGITAEFAGGMQFDEDISVSLLFDSFLKGFEGDASGVIGGGGIACPKCQRIGKFRFH